MLLTDKSAVVHGASGAIGSAVARTFAAEGARVHLAGRTLATLETIAEEIRATGGQASTAVVDALDPDAVADHAAAVVAESGRIDIMLNAVGVDHVQGVPLTELSAEDFVLPIRTYTWTNFVTATAAGRQMARQGCGVILMLSTTAARVAMPTDGFGPANARNGSHVARIWGRMAARAGLSLEEMLDSPGAPNALLPRPLRIQDVADAASFLASDRAGALTATTLNLSLGAVLG